ncbi:MAG: Gfo/Idh/MocA family oxidoreductase [Kiritimatiellae bacterium]|jgi:scyllo-inositol 2-dehydrogenase (NADP+)|nr:Gfo/Idh/MocA family oxidoreductase [Kiritimatiellia bacterium]
MKKYKKTSDIKVGVVGYGGAFNMGKKHLEEMQKTGMIPTAVLEIDKSRLAVAGEDFPGIQTYTSIDKMIKESGVNMVAIITPHNTHAKLAMKFLKEGISVVCEKPLAITTAECDAMIKAAKENKALLSTYHNRHWDGCVLEAVKRIVKKGEIGDLIKVNARCGGFGQPGDWWRSSKTISGGIMYDWGVHFLEYCLQIIDAGITEVSGFSKSSVWDTKWAEDTIESEGYAVIRFDNGVWMNLMVTNIDQNIKDGMIEFTGTDGTYIMNHGDYKIIKHKKNGQKTIVEGKNTDSKQDLYYKNVADALTGKEKLVITGEWSRRPIQILDLAVKSAKQGKALKAKHK